MKQTRVILFALCLLFTSLSTTVNAQCAMCRATVESNLDSEKTVGKGLNKGILYLMTIPYIVLAGVGYMVYKNRKGRV